MLRGLALIAAIIGAAQAAPCDIYAKAGTPCVAAHSTVRAMFSEYKGPLYQVQRTSDKKTTDVKPLKAGGIANAATQDKFCKHERCVISILYDQSGKGNHLTPAPGGGFITTPDDPANAAQHPIMVNGKKAYGVWIDLGMGYRNNNTTDIPVGDEAEAIYMLASGLHFNKGCCFDYGNAETTNNNDGSATMEALYLGSAKAWNFGPGAGPWVMADLENGVYGSNVTDLKHECPNLEPVSGLPYVTAMLKGRSGGTYALKQGNGQYGKLKTTYDGPRPTGYTVMKKQGGILLGIGGDNSNSGNGTFYEGALIKGNPSDSVDDQVQADIVAARYATPVTLPPPPMQKPKLNDMCGGNAYAGLTECAEGVCVELNEWNWRCQLPENTTAPVTTAPASSVPVTTAPAALAKLYEQCGGKLWTGATKCVQGAECKFYNDWFSQCVPVSPNQTPAL